MRFWKYPYRTSVFLLALSIFSNVVAGEAKPASAPQTTSLWQSAQNTVLDVAEKGKWDGYFSGYGKHFAHPSDGRLNEHLWGGGFGKTLRNEKGNDDSLFVLVTQDSNWNKQYAVGYMHQWIHPLANSSIEVGGGYTAFIIRRLDMASGAPIPIVLPVASIGTKKAKLMTTIAPYTGGHSTSAVLYLFGKYTFD